VTLNASSTGSAFTNVGMVGTASTRAAALKCSDSVVVPAGGLGAGFGLDHGKPWNNAVG
jgi:hypothetical protein